MGAAPQPGRVFDRYRLLEKLGEGGMGVVWRAEDTRLGRQVALKFLPPEAAHDSTRRQRFEQEARAAAALSHPTIATVHELAESEGQTFIVFEYVPGKTLRSSVAPGGVPPTELLDIAADIADALAAAHAAGVVHRDLKPENVMRAPSGRCKVLDFGLARINAAPTSDGETRSNLTSPGIAVGTVGYMAPEQLEAKPVDFRADIFSFGTLLYELATGIHPFQGGSAASTIAAILKDDPRPLTERNRLQPAELERIVHKCLRKRPEERYQSTADLVTDLRNLKHDSSERPPTVAGAREEKSRRDPRFYQIAVARAIVLSMLLSAGWYYTRDAEQLLVAAWANDDAIAIAGFVLTYSLLAVVLVANGTFAVRCWQGDVRALASFIRYFPLYWLLAQPWLGVAAAPLYTRYAKSIFTNPFDPVSIIVGLLLNPPFLVLPFYERRLARELLRASGELEQEVTRPRIDRRFLHIAATQTLMLTFYAVMLWVAAGKTLADAAFAAMASLNVGITLLYIISVPILAAVVVISAALAVRATRADMRALRIFLRLFPGYWLIGQAWLVPLAWIVTHMPASVAGAALIIGLALAAPFFAMPFYQRRLARELLRESSRREQNHMAV